MHRKFDQLCSVICSGSIEPVSIFSCGWFYGRSEIIDCGSKLRRIFFGLVQVAVILDLCD